MGLIHTPRTIYSILNGVYKRQLYLRQPPPPPLTSQQKHAVNNGPPPPPPVKKNNNNNNNTIAIGLGVNNDPHIYQARLGLFDIDYLGHMNNAAYLTHAELARWELTSYNGMLPIMLQQKVHFLVVGTTIRYRKEIRPIFGTFQIDTTMCGLDDRNLYMMHQFRTIHQNNNKNNNNKNETSSRIMAQMIVQGVAVQNGRTVINPGTFLKDVIGFDSNIVDSIMVSNMINPSSTTCTTSSENNNNIISDNDDTNNNNQIIVELMDRYTALEDTMKKATAIDDQRFNATTTSSNGSSTP